jgi:SAM-dependent methyltransferase
MPPLRFFEIAETHHRLQNPLSEQKLLLLGEVCRLKEGTRFLDLACGKGEMLCNWAKAHGIIGYGVDISEVFIKAARARAFQLDVSDQLTFVQDYAEDYPQEHHEFDVVTCLGASFIGGGLMGTLDLMKTALKPRDGMLIVGEPYWHLPPPEEVVQAMGLEMDTYATLSGTLQRFEMFDAELVEMVVSNTDDWDRYRAPQWSAIIQFVEANPDDPDAEALYRWMGDMRRLYLSYERDYMGWGVFVLRV